MCRILVHSNIRCTENTDQWNIYKQMKVICVGFVLFGGGFFVGFWCCFCLKSKTEVYLDLLAGFGNDIKKPRSRKNGLKKSCLFLPVAWTRHSIGLSCSCKCLDALQVISLVTEGSLDFFFLRRKCIIGCMNFQEQLGKTTLKLAWMWEILANIWKCFIPYHLPCQPAKKKRRNNMIKI